MTSDYLPHGDWGRLFPYLQYENMLVVRVALETGLRVGDIVALKAADLDKTNVHFVAQKTGKAGQKQISADLAKRLRAVSGAEWVFNGRSKGHRTRQAVWKDIKQAAAACGLEGQISPHSARKTYAVDLYDNKGLPAVMRELQHDRADTSLIYALSAGGRGDRAIVEQILRGVEKMVDELYNRIVEHLKKLGFDEESAAGNQLKALDMLCSLKGFYSPSGGDGSPSLVEVIETAYKKRMDVEKE